VSEKPRLIQKYPNRRMYDTTQHRYVTLDEIRAFVMDGVDFTVVDKRDQSDITFATLLNVLAKVHAACREACLDRQILLDAIRALGHDRNLPGHEFTLAVPVDLATGQVT
jgi:polyhydroxyalkanoate synthesis repressor PhaR